MPEAVDGGNRHVIQGVRLWTKGDPSRVRHQADCGKHQRGAEAKAAEAAEDATREAGAADRDNAGCA